MGLQLLRGRASVILEVTEAPLARASARLLSPRDGQCRTTGPVTRLSCVWIGPEQERCTVSTWRTPATIRRSDRGPCGVHPRGLEMLPPRVSSSSRGDVLRVIDATVSAQNIMACCATIHWTQPYCVRSRSRVPPNTAICPNRRADAERDDDNPALLTRCETTRWRDTPKASPPVTPSKPSGIRGASPTGALLWTSRRNAGSPLAIPQVRPLRLASTERMLDR